MPDRQPLRGRRVLLAGLDPRLGGGVPAMMSATARNITALGGHVEFLHLAQSDNPGPGITMTFQWSGAPCHAVGYRRTPNTFLNYVAPARRARALVRRFDTSFAIGVAQPGLFFAAAERPYSAWLATTVTDEFRSRSFRHELRDRQWTLLANRASLPMSRLAERYALRGARLYALSEATEVVLHREYPAASMGLLAFPIDTTRFTPGPSAREPRILYVGRVDDNRKNVPLLMRAFKTVLRRLPDAELHLVGEYAPTGRAATVARELDLGSSVYFRGEYPPARLPELYRQAAVFALPSIQEGLGIVALEAMASGTPVVSTRCGGPEADIERSGAGFLVATDAVDEFADRLTELLRDTLLRDMLSERGIQYVRGEHSDAAFQSTLLSREGWQ